MYINTILTIKIMYFHLSLFYHAHINSSMLPICAFHVHICVTV